MRRLAAILALVLGLTLLAAHPASASVAASAEKCASGSAATLRSLIEESTPLSEDAVRENDRSGYDLASDDAVAARAGAQNAANAGRLSRQLGSQEGVGELLSGGGKAIAGAGTNVPLRDVGRLVSQYGGKAGDWAKVTSTAPGHLQTHAYRNVVTGEVVELKSIVP